MTKLFIVKHRPFKPGYKFKSYSRAERENSLDLTREVEDPIAFDLAEFYRASDEAQAVENRRISIYGKNWPTTAREFTDEEYRKTFEQSPGRKVEWLGEALGLGEQEASDLFCNMPNKKLNTFVSKLAGRTIKSVNYR